MHFNDFNKSRRSYQIFLEMKKGLVPPAPLATSIVIESDIMSLSQL